MTPGSKLREHLVCSTALIVQSTPVFAALETVVAKMPQDVSLNSRLIAAGMFYAGLGYAFNAGREVYRKFAGVKQTDSETKQVIHDSIYGSAFSLAISPPIYVIAGSRSLSEIGIASLCAAGIGIANGPFAGYFVDTYKDLCQITPCERQSYPTVVRNARPVLKKTLAALITAGSIALTAGIYQLQNNSTYEEKIIEPQSEIFINDSF